jgi:hypothetical protein
MLIYTTILNSFYTISKGIRRATLLNFSKAKSLLPVNLPRVNTTYFSTNSEYFGNIFLNNFDLQQQKSSRTGKVIANSKIKMNKCNINSVIRSFDISCKYFINVLAYSDNIFAGKKQNLIFYFFVMNEEFFVKASVRLLKAEVIRFPLDPSTVVNPLDNIVYNSDNTNVAITLYNDPIITDIIYMGFYIVITDDTEVKEEYYQKIKISI